MQQITTGSLRQDHCWLCKRLRLIVVSFRARSALALIAVLFIVGLSPIFVDQQNVAYAAEVQNMSHPTTSAQPINSNELTGSAATTSDQSMMSMMSMMQNMMSMMQTHAMAMPAKCVTINGDVIVIVLKK